MPEFKVEVGVALQRPPRTDAYAWVMVEAHNGDEAELIACQIAMCDKRVVMPVSSLVVDWPEDHVTHDAYDATPATRHTSRITRRNDASDVT